MKHLKYFNEYLNERFDISSPKLNESIVLMKTEDDSYFLLYDTNNKEALGCISFGYSEIADVYPIYGAFASNGYGAFLYETAMTYVYPKGCSLSRSSNTSYDALDVWEKFSKRNDVIKERMYSDELTHKREDLPAGGTYDNNPEELERILELEDTRFFFTYGKEKLDTLIEKGRIYQEENDISDDEIEEICIDLEGRLY
jgi:hypothetical protein